MLIDRQNYLTAENAENAEFVPEKTSAPSAV